MTGDPKKPQSGAPENEEEGLSFPGEPSEQENVHDRAIIDDTADPAERNEIERDDDAPLSDPKPT